MSGDPRLVLTTAPFVHEGTSTPRIMLEVLGAALVVLGVATYHFGLAALLVVGAATVGAVATEWLANGKRRTTLDDYSAALTGVLLGLTLPPGFPLWMAFLGGVAGVGLGKLVWGGLGQNAFNPALVGRAFLQSAFPTAITTWTVNDSGGLPASLFAAPLMRAPEAVDAVSAATPLGLSKFEGVVTDTLPLLTGATPGSLGETSAIVLVLCGLYLIARRLCDWRLPVATLLSVAVFSLALHLLAPESHPPPTFMLASGGLLFGAVFMVTDPVTSPTTPRGAWLFGIGVGFLVVLIRRFGGLPEGVMYAILLMNAASPHLESATRRRPFGAKGIKT